MKKKTTNRRRLFRCPRMWAANCAYIFHFFRNTAQQITHTHPHTHTHRGNPKPSRLVLHLRLRPFDVQDQMIVAVAVQHFDGGGGVAAVFEMYVGESLAQAGVLHMDRQANHCVRLHNSDTESNEHSPYRGPGTFCSAVRSS